jgi:hypothetical protein
MVNRKFLLPLGIGLVTVAIGLGVVFVGTKGAHLALEGKILKVRTLATDDKNSIAVIDFRVTNEATQQDFVVKDAIAVVTTADGKEVEGSTIARTDVNRVFDYYKVLGQKFNETLIMRDTVGRGKTMDRMVAVTFALAEPDIEKRKSMKLRLHDVDGPTFELTESGK